MQRVRWAVLQEEGEQGYDYWIYLFEELTMRLDTYSVKGSG